MTGIFGPGGFIGRPPTPHEVSLVSGVAHAFAATFSDVPEAEDNLLLVSIEGNGLQNPIAINTLGLILAGRRRFAACQRIMNRRGEDLVPEHARARYLVYDLTEEQEFEFILAENVQRRHMSTGERAMVAAEWATVGNFGKAPKLERRAQELGVSVSTLQDAERVLKSGRKDLIAKVKSGQLAVSKAASQIPRERPRRSPAKQKTTPKLADVLQFPANATTSETGPVTEGQAQRAAADRDREAGAEPDTDIPEVEVKPAVDQATPEAPDSIEEVKDYLRERSAPKDRPDIKMFLEQLIYQDRALAEFDSRVTPKR